MKHGLATIAAGVALAALAGCSAGHPSPSPVSMSPTSAQLPAFSRYVGFSVPGFPPNPDNLLILEDATGVRPTAVSIYMSLGKKLDIAAVSSLRSSGVLPVVEIDSDKIPLRDIAAGTEDGWLTSYAREIASVHGTIAIDFDHEFNAPWSDWGYTHESAATFTAAWRHVVTVFRRNGAANVAWVWNPNVSDSSTSAIRPWYPGNAWVTMVGLDGYFFTPRATFSTVFGPTIRQIHTFTHRPVLIVETGANPSANRPAQISDLFEGAREAGIVGVIWFDYHKWTSHDWLINNDPAALAAFRKAAEKYQ
jgi:mannan endo-1,4-beta-mannosidase